MFKQVKIDEEFDAHLLSLPDPGKYPSDKDADGRYTHKDTQSYHAGWLASRQALYFERNVRAIPLLQGRVKREVTWFWSRT